MKRKLSYLLVGLFVLAASVPRVAFFYSPKPALAGSPPIVTTENATSITSNSAVLNGTLTSLGSAALANVSFQWGTRSGNYTVETPPVSMNATGAFSANITGLSAGTAYYFRAKAAAGDNVTVYGAGRGFITLAPPRIARVRIGAQPNVVPDTTFRATVDISQVNNFDAADYELLFNPAVLRLDDVSNGNIGGSAIPVDVWTQVSPGRFRIVQNVPGLPGVEPGSTPVTGSGYLSVLHFKVIGSPGQSSNISLSLGTLSNTLAQEIPAAWSAGFVEVVSVIPGDANGDGRVNALDITKVERVIARLDPVTPGADANGDGAVNAVDITKVERIIAGLDVPSGVGLELVAQGFASPLGVVPAPDGTGRLFIFDQVGTIWIMTVGRTVLSEPFLDLRGRMVELNPGYDERGLLGFAFHPAYEQNGRFFVYYSAPLRPGGPSGWNHTSHISEFRVSAGDPNKADPASERVVLQVDEPQFNHNAGQIAFGPDGYLYIPLGDGGASNDTGLGHSPTGNGQDPSTLLGKILRIDVDGGTPYAVPPDNPFVGKDGRDEIFALGFRNPYRISFDSGGARQLFAGDAGQVLWEEVDIVVKGGNYGWNIKEGKHCFDPNNPGVSPPQCPNVDAGGRPLLDPIIEYGNAAAGGIGTAVIGGFVYRGSYVPALQGAYIFGDFSSSWARADGKLFVATRPLTPGGAWDMKELKIRTSPDGRLNAFLRSFGQDGEGELFVLTADGAGPAGTSGKIYRIAE